MEIDTRLILRMALKTRADTTPERTVTGTIETVATCHQRCEIAHHRGEGVLLTQDMVIEGTLIIVGYLRVRLIAELTVSQFQQVVRTAVLTIIACQVLRLLRGFEGMLRSISPSPKADR